MGIFSSSFRWGGSGRRRGTGRRCWGRRWCRSGEGLEEAGEKARVWKWAQLWRWRGLVGYRHRLGFGGGSGLGGGRLGARWGSRRWPAKLLGGGGSSRRWGGAFFKLLVHQQALSARPWRARAGGRRAPLDQTRRASPQVEVSARHCDGFALLLAGEGGDNVLGSTPFS